MTMSFFYLKKAPLLQIIDALVNNKNNRSLENNLR
jgi:hypothetical protein